MWTDDKCAKCNSGVAVKHYFRNRGNGDTFSQYFCSDGCSDSYYERLMQTHERFAINAYVHVAYDRTISRRRR